MKKATILYFAFLIFSPLSCDFIPENNKPVNLAPGDYRLSGDTLGYKMMIPDFMKDTEDLNAEASLQCMNAFREIYTIVIDEDKEILIDAFRGLDQYNDSLNVAENYRNIQLGLLKEAMDIKERRGKKSLKINGLNAEQIELRSSLDNIDSEISYFLTFIEGRENVYMIMSWTLADRGDKYRNMFQTMAASFRLKQF